MSTTNNKPIIQPYLFFNGTCEEAVEFYRKALGAEVETERARLMQWFGPKGFTMPAARMDLRPGGSFHYCLCY